MARISNRHSRPFGGCAGAVVQKRGTRDFSIHPYTIVMVFSNYAAWRAFANMEVWAVQFHIEQDSPLQDRMSF